ncbi:ribonuclease III [Ureaplasma parvum serovar 14 str. ATCC 33697]|uniref:ribonuclease III n=1 Tax=Ureaplasma parvum TaxID=134821 RepID=UPI0001725184|nr:ribonuclease III [Ureaplasma parvum]EDT87663.1 ribonuclease III [Ureaplasma parvum serovar 14 str. ATCC 33697]
MDNKKFLDFLKQNRIEPKNLSIYLEALTHKSYANEHKLTKNYQRLEFLGDACVEWVISNFIFNYKIKDNEKMHSLDEGEMTRARSNMVRSEILSYAAKDLGLTDFLMIGVGLEQDQSARMEKIYEDIFEAFIGAVAQDQGIKKVSLILEKTLIKYFREGQINYQKDYKTIFQEQAQRINKKPIMYKLVRNEGDKKEVHLVWNDLIYGIGIASTRKEAEILAAKNAILKLDDYTKKA